MRNLIIVIVSAIIIFSIGYLMDMNTVPVAIESNENTSDSISMELPTFSFKDINAKEYTMNDFKGKYVILNFWASWCAPCMEEFPEILKVLKNHKEDILLVAISNDDNIKDVKKFLKKFKKEISGVITNIILGFDPKRDISSTMFNVIKLPESFIVNREGLIIKKVVGSSDWIEGKVSDFIEKQVKK